MAEAARAPLGASENDDLAVATSAASDPAIRRKGWTVKGVPQTIRDQAKHAAHSRGETLGAWLNTLIASATSDGTALPARRAAPADLVEDAVDRIGARVEEALADAGLNARRMRRMTEFMLEMAERLEDLEDAYLEREEVRDRTERRKVAADDAPDESDTAPSDAEDDGAPRPNARCDDVSVAPAPTAAIPAARPSPLPEETAHEAHAAPAPDAWIEAIGADDAEVIEEIPPARATLQTDEGSFWETVETEPDDVGPDALDGAPRRAALRLSEGAVDGDMPTPPPTWEEPPSAAEHAAHEADCAAGEPSVWEEYGDLAETASDAPNDASDTASLDARIAHPEAHADGPQEDAPADETVWETEDDASDVASAEESALSDARPAADGFETMTQVAWLPPLAERSLSTTAPIDIAECRRRLQSMEPNTPPWRRGGVRRREKEEGVVDGLWRAPLDLAQASVEASEAPREDEPATIEQAAPPRQERDPQAEKTDAAPISAEPAPRLAVEIAEQVDSALQDKSTGALAQFFASRSAPKRAPDAELRNLLEQERWSESATSAEREEADYSEGRSPRRVVFVCALIVFVAVAAAAALSGVVDLKP